MPFAAQPTQYYNMGLSLGSKVSSAGKELAAVPGKILETKRKIITVSELERQVEKAKRDEAKFEELKNWAISTLPEQVKVDRITGAERAQIENLYRTASDPEDLMKRMGGVVKRFEMVQMKPKDVISVGSYAELASDPDRINRDFETRLQENFGAKRKGEERAQVKNEVNELLSGLDIKKTSREQAQSAIKGIMNKYPEHQKIIDALTQPYLSELDMAQKKYYEAGAKQRTTAAGKNERELNLVKDFDKEYNTELKKLETGWKALMQKGRAGKEDVNQLLKDERFRFSMAARAIAFALGRTGEDDGIYDKDIRLMAQSVVDAIGDKEIEQAIPEIDSPVWPLIRDSVMATMSKYNDQAKKKFGGGDDDTTEPPPKKEGPTIKGVLGSMWKGVTGGKSAAAEPPAPAPQSGKYKIRKVSD